MLTVGPGPTIHYAVDTSGRVWIILPMGWNVLWSRIVLASRVIPAGLFAKRSDVVAIDRESWWEGPDQIGDST